MQDLAFRTLLYRYFFFTWLFKDASEGNLLERTAAWHYNQQQARWLLTYMRRWLWCGVVLYSIGSFVEMMLDSPGLSAVFYVPGALSVPVNAAIAAAWIALKALPGPL